MSTSSTSNPRSNSLRKSEKSEIICTTENEFMTTMCNAIMTTALSEKSQQVIFDGEDLRIEEIICREFTRGYVIPYDSQQFDMPSPDSRRFTKWLADLLFIHANACCEYLQSHDYIIKFSTDTDSDYHSQCRNQYQNRNSRSKYKSDCDDSSDDDCSEYDNRNFNM